MKGHGERLSRKVEQAVIALLSAKTVEEAARSVGISVKTLRRWQKLPEFEKKLRESRISNFRHSMARLQQASVPAVTTLLKLMVDAATPVAVKARCAYYVLEQMRKAIEIEEIEARISNLELASGSKQEK